MRPRVVVVGAGIAGLTAAHELQRLGADLDVACLEAGPVAGGCIHSSCEDGFLCEWAANGFLDDAPATLALIRRLGLESRLLPAASSAASRHIFRAGKLRLLPRSPFDLLRADLLSWPGKLRLMAEPLISPRRAGASDESVFDFARRRAGGEAAAILADAVVSGIHAGDARRLSLAAVFPRLSQWEREHGSVLRGMLARRRERRVDRARLTSFKDGMQELTGALARELGSRLLLNARVIGLVPNAGGGFRVHLDRAEPWIASAVLLACPAHIASQIVAALDRELSRVLASISTAPLAAVHFGYREELLGSAPDGFGFLVPRGQGPRLLGVLNASNIFADRAPQGCVLLTAMAGGAHDPGAVDLPEAQLLELIRSDLRRVLAVSAEPSFVKVVRHKPGLPQYELGHLERLALIDERLQQHPGLSVCGSSYRGVSINACVAEAERAAGALLASIGATARPRA